MGAGNPVTPSDLGVFMDQSAERVTAQNTHIGHVGGPRCVAWLSSPGSMPTLWVPIIHPCRSGGMQVLVEGARSRSRLWTSSCAIRSGPDRQSVRVPGEGRPPPRPGRTGQHICLGRQQLIQPGRNAPHAGLSRWPGSSPLPSPQWQLAHGQAVDVTHIRPAEWMHSSGPAQPVLTGIFTAVEHGGRMGPLPGDRG